MNTYVAPRWPLPWSITPVLSAVSGRMIAQVRERHACGKAECLRSVLGYSFRSSARSSVLYRYGLWCGAAHFTFCSCRPLYETAPGAGSGRSCDTTVRYREVKGSLYPVVPTRWSCAALALRTFPGLTGRASLWGRPQSGRLWPIQGRSVARSG